MFLETYNCDWQLRKVCNKKLNAMIYEDGKIGEDMPG